MQFYNLNNPTEKVSFRQAAITGQAADKGLFFPENIPVCSKQFIDNLNDYTATEIGFEVMKPYVEKEIPDDVLFSIVEQTLNFPFPLQKITDDIYSLELFHGPTLAFKDVGARFMSRVLGYFSNADKKVTVLVATSGDTGGAVANGFLGTDNVEVIILYPSKKVSTVQEMQLTRLGKNISAVEVEGTFDDCQAIVKKAIADTELNKQYQLTSANSINIARWLPQQLYYFLGYKQWLQLNDYPNPVVAVPSGNFGNICAGLLAKQSGLPLGKMIAACNKNDVVYRYLNTEQYEVMPSVQTISNAMDVGNPSNFIRVMKLFHNNLEALKNSLVAYSVSDETTIETIATIWNSHQYMLEPHGAVSYHALQQYNEQFSTKGFITETAHPVKFPEVVEKITGRAIEIPNQVKSLLEKEKQATLMPANFNNFKEWMRNRNNQ